MANSKSRHDAESRDLSDLPLWLLKRSSMVSNGELVCGEICLVLHLSPARDLGLYRLPSPSDSIDLRRLKKLLLMLFVNFSA